LEEIRRGQFIEKVKTIIEAGHLGKYINAVEMLTAEDYDAIDIAAALFKHYLHDASAEEIDFTEPAYTPRENAYSKTSARYKTAKTVKAALIRAGGSRNRARKIIFVSSVFVLMLISFFVGGLTAFILENAAERGQSGVSSSRSRNTPTLGTFVPNITETGEYIFNEPLIGEAARLMLGKNEDEPVTLDDLESIDSMYITGSHVSVTYTDPDAVFSYGNIRTLEDLRAMQNLRELVLLRQPLKDIMPLTDCKQLQILRLIDCDISDISVFSELPNLYEITLCQTPVTDYTVLEKIENLQILWLGESMGYSNIRDLGYLPNLLRLGMRGRGLINLEGVENVPMLRTLDVAYTFIRDFSPLNDTGTLPFLTELYIDVGMVRYLDTLERDDIEIITVY
jgi:hypothetical protein